MEKSQKIKCLVVGGAGFIGSHLVDRLIKTGFSVSVIDNLSAGKKENLNPRAKFFRADIKSGGIKNIFRNEKPNAVFHYAAHIEARDSVKNPLNDAMTNIIGGLNVIEQCRKFGVKKIIFASSGGEIYGNASQIPTPETFPLSPISPYGVAKLSMERYLSSYAALFGIDYLAARYGNVYGPRQNPCGESGVIAIFGQKMMAGKTPTIHGDGKQTKDYIFIDDAVDATLLCFKKNVSGEINIAAGKEVSVNEIFARIKKIVGFKGMPRYAPLPSCGLKRGCLCIDKIQRDLGWWPKVDFSDGLSKTIIWLKENQELR